MMSTYFSFNHAEEDMPIAQDILGKYRSIDPSALAKRESLGDLNFGEFAEAFQEIKAKLDESIALAEKYNASEVIMRKLGDILNRYVAVLSPMLSLNIKNNNAPTLRGSLAQEANTFLKGFYTPTFQPGYTKDEEHFNNIYSQLKFRDAGDIENRKAEYQNLIGELKLALEEAKSKSEEATSQLHATANLSVTEAVIDYAEIFEKEAQKYYHWKWSWPQIGSQQSWLVVAIVSIGFLFSYLLNIVPNSLENIDKKNISVSPHLTHPDSIGVLNSKSDSLQAFSSEIFYTKTLPNMIAHIIIVALLIFLVRFSLRQYSIARHLYTVNIHRANILKSYRLFIQGPGRDQPEVLNTLLIEVAKAINPVGATGYIEDKSTEINFPLISEILKIPVAK